MEKGYQRTSTKSYMIVNKTTGAYHDFEIKMLLNNKIPGLLPVQVMMINAENEYWFDISSMQSLERKQAISLLRMSDLKLFLRSLMDLKMTLDEYLLDDEDIVYNDEFIYFDRTSKSVLFTFIPGYHNESEYDLQSFLEKLVNQIDHKDTEAAKLAYAVLDAFTLNGILPDHLITDDTNEEVEQENRIVTSGMRMDISSINDSGFIEIDGFADANDNISRDEIRMLRTNETSKSRRSKKEKLPKEKMPKEKNKKVKEKQKSTGGLFGKRNNSRVCEPVYDNTFREAGFDSISGRDETAVLNKPIMSDATVCFSDANLSKVWELKYLGDGLERDILLTRFPFVIGTDASHVNHAMTARTISRVHCSFSLQGEVLMLEDYNSTNGTYINGSLVQIGSPFQVSNGDHIVFATEEYELRQKIKSGKL